MFRKKREEGFLKKMKQKSNTKILKMYAKRFGKKMNLENKDRLKELAKVRKKIYTNQLKKERINMQEKRQFQEDIHIYDRDRDIISSTKEASKNLDKNENDSVKYMAGKLLDIQKNCMQCGKQFSTYSSFLEHVKIVQRNQKHYKVPRKGFVSKGEHYRLICKKPDCCFHTQNLKDFDIHMKDKHEVTALATMVDIYQTLGESSTDNMKTCTRCKTIFHDPTTMKRHLITCLGRMYVNCEECNMNFESSLDYIEHFKSIHKPPTTMVRLNEFREKNMSDNKTQLEGKMKITEDRRKRYTQVRTQFQTLSLFSRELTDLAKVLSHDTFMEVKKNLVYELEVNTRLVFYFYAPTIISRLNNDGEKEYRFSRIRSSRNFKIGPHSDIDDVLRQSFENFWSVADYLAEQGSGKKFC